MAEFHLLVNENKESRLASDYLKQQGINPRVHKYTEEGLKENLEHPFPHVNANLYANSEFLNEPNMPFLVVDAGISQWGYPSFSGVKSFLRKKISGLDEATFEKYHTPFWRVNCYDAFYPKVTCFNEKQEKFFQGDKSKAPYNFGVLNLHDFKQWHEASCWKVGKLEELAKKQDKNGVVKDSKTLTILFPDDLEILERGKIVPFTDSRNMYQVSFEAYFNNGGNIFGISADMVD
ncbi:hypothetical protein HY449_00560 [Candidatus Pacearchaeota archaeon]|nr:hypothetical protein [Candidatus Pacearchaeota archaeon]